jgi:hypothetical protein
LHRAAPSDGIMRFEKRLIKKANPEKRFPDSLYNEMNNIRMSDVFVSKSDVSFRLSAERPLREAKRSEAGVCARINKMYEKSK